MCQHHTFRLTRGAGGVEDHSRIVRRERYTLKVFQVAVRVRRSPGYYILVGMHCMYCKMVFTCLALSRLYARGNNMLHRGNIRQCATQQSQEDRPPTPLLCRPVSTN